MGEKNLTNKAIWAQTFQDDSYLVTYSDFFRGFPGGSEGKASACNAGDLGLIPDWEELLEKEMATHSSILAWTSFHFSFFLSDFFYGNQSTQVFNLFLSNLENYTLVICPFHKEFIIH